MRTIKQIIQRRKERGIDCTESESAEIKGYLRELKTVGEQKIVADIQTYFPLEYDEYLRENDLDAEEDEDWNKLILSGAMKPIKK